MSICKKPIIGITLGDPAGIGPEIVSKSLKKPSIAKSAKFKIIGDAKTFSKYYKKAPKNITLIDIPLKKQKKVKPGSPDRSTAKASLRYLETAVELLKKKEIDALVTAPVCKEAITSISKGKFYGHTEFLAGSFNITNFDMMFVCESLKTVVVTRHIPLKDVPRAITKEKVLKTICLVDKTLKHFFKIKDPKIGLCGLNPHAGEGGDIGIEEITKIIPAIRQAKKKRINVEGPFPADTIFSPDTAGNYDTIITMYHDQGTIPVKTLAFNGLVNLTIGLPFVRTSPAHGTAFNIAGKNIANPSSMCESIKLAAKLACRK